MKQAFITTKLTYNTRQTLTPITDSFESLYNQYVGKVYQKCLSFTKDPDTAQDFTQDIFIKVFDKLDTFSNRSSFSTWLYSVSHNHCLDQIKISKRFSTEALSDSISASMAEQDPTPSVEYRLQALEGVMKNLPAQEVAFLRLKYEQGLSIREIAQQHAITESTVKMRLKRTRDKLNALYHNREDD